MRHTESSRVRVKWHIGHMGVTGMPADMNKSPVSDSWSTLPIRKCNSLVLGTWDWKLQFS